MFNSPQADLPKFPPVNNQLTSLTEKATDAYNQAYAIYNQVLNGFTSDLKILHQDTKVGLKLDDGAAAPAMYSTITFYGDCLNEANACAGRIAFYDKSLETAHKMCDIRVERLDNDNAKFILDVMTDGTENNFLEITNSGFRVNTVVIAGAYNHVDGYQLVCARQAAIADAVGTDAAEVAGVVNAILGALRTHGLIAT